MLNPARHPAGDLMALYHERWQIETTFYSIKCNILDGRVLRSRRPDYTDQEIWALLSVYQAIVWIGAASVDSCTVAAWSASSPAYPLVRWAWSA